MPRAACDAARAVVELFDTRDAEEALRLAAHLDARNQERKEVQQQIFDLDINEFEVAGSLNQSHVAVIAGENWHRGVIGIAASKIAERLNRPCVVLSIEGDVAHGSGRSIEAYHLLNGLSTCADLFDKFGGHSHAAGITLKRKRIDEFRKRLNEHAAGCLTDDDLQPCVRIDAELALEAIGWDLIQELSSLEPFGAGNARPVFVTRNLRVVSEPRVLKERHLKMNLRSLGSRPFEAVWWNCLDQPRRIPQINESIELAYSIEASSWNEQVRLQLNVEDVRMGAR